MSAQAPLGNPTNAAAFQPATELLRPEGAPATPRQAPRPRSAPRHAEIRDSPPDPAAEIAAAAAAAAPAPPAAAGSDAEELAAAKRARHEATLARLRSHIAELDDDAWMYEAPRHTAPS
jgi:hypothetical protein